MYLNLQPVSKILDCNFGSSSSLPSLLILLLMMTKKREGKKKMMMMTMMSVGRNVLKEKTSCVLLVLSLFPLFLSLPLSLFLDWDTCLVSYSYLILCFLSFLLGFSPFFHCLLSLPSFSLSPDATPSSLTSSHTFTLLVFGLRQFLFPPYTFQVF